MKFKAESLPMPRQCHTARACTVDNVLLAALERAKFLESADFFESAHKAASQSGQSAVPENVHVDTHFIAFIEAENEKG